MLTKALQAASGTEIEKLIERDYSFLRSARACSPGCSRSTCRNHYRRCRWRRLAYRIGTEAAIRVEPRGIYHRARLSESCPDLLAAVSEMINRSRLRKPELSGIEQFVRAAAYQALEAGTALPLAFRGIGVSGFQPLSDQPFTGGSGRRTQSRHMSRYAAPLKRDDCPCGAH